MKSKRGSETPSPGSYCRLWTVDSAVSCRRLTGSGCRYSRLGDHTPPLQRTRRLCPASGQALTAATGGAAMGWTIRRCSVATRSAATE